MRFLRGDLKKLTGVQKLRWSSSGRHLSRDSKVTAQQAQAARCTGPASPSPQLSLAPRSQVVTSAQS
jgi:hypothetical protein